MKSTNDFRFTGRANPVLYRHLAIGQENTLIPAPGVGKRLVICDIIVNGDITYSTPTTATSTVDKAGFKVGTGGVAQWLFWLEEGAHHFTPFALPENMPLETEREGDDGTGHSAWDVTVTYWIDSSE